MITFMQFINDKQISLSVSELNENNEIHFIIEDVENNDPMYSMGMFLPAEQMLRLKTWIDEAVARLNEKSP